MSQSSDNSRTFRVLNLTDDVKAQLTDAVVTQHENVHYVEVNNVSKIANVKKIFDDAEIKYKQCSYSTFVRFTDSMTIDDLNKVASEACENVNVLYSRVDENNHTGKLVVDRLEDYNKLKSTTGNVSFFRFSPLNVPRVQNRNYQGRNTPQGDNNGNWQTVGRPQTVRGRYGQANRPQQNANVPAPVQAPVPVAPRVGAGRGRGAVRGRGVARGPPA